MSRCFLNRCLKGLGKFRVVVLSLLTVFSAACSSSRPLVLYPWKLSTTYHAFSIEHSSGCAPSQFENSVGNDLPPGTFDIVATIFSNGLFECVSSNPGGGPGIPGMGRETGYISAFGSVDFHVSNEGGASDLLETLLDNGVRAVLQFEVDAGSESNRGMRLLIAPITRTWGEGIHRVGDSGEGRSFYVDRVNLERAIYTDWEANQAVVEVDVTPIVEVWATGQMTEFGFLVAPSPPDLEILEEGDRSSIRGQPTLLLVSP